MCIVFRRFRAGWLSNLNPARAGDADDRHFRCYFAQLWIIKTGHFLIFLQYISVLMFHIFVSYHNGCIDLFAANV